MAPDAPFSIKEERQVSRTSGDRTRDEAEGGIAGLVILKSTGSEFAGYIKDGYTR
ncbi:MAG: hypothetical protein ACK4WH_06180 [Phycisphaerales bacterium]